MLDALKRLIQRRHGAPQWPEVHGWAQANKLQFKRIRDAEGFVIENGTDGRSWRLEWGAPQRDYIGGNELRLRLDAGLPSHLQMLLMSRSLMEHLERSTFERFTASNQTVIDATTPEEMRWLALFPSVSLPGSKNLRAHYRLVSSLPEAAVPWVDGPLASQLEIARQRLLAADPPFVLMVLRGRVYLRMQMVEPQPSAMAQAIQLFEVAVLQALRVGGTGSSDVQGAWPTTSSTAWQTLVPEEPPASPRH